MPSGNAFGYATLATSARAGKCCVAADAATIAARANTVPAHGEVREVKRRRRGEEKRDGANARIPNTVASRRERFPNADASLFACASLDFRGIRNGAAYGAAAPNATRRYSAPRTRFAR